MALIIGLGGPAPTLEFSLTASPLVIGRLGRCDICIDHAKISRRHARILREEENWILEDLDSTNYVFLNREIVTRTTLAHGDVFNVGGAAEFIFLDHPDPDRVMQARRRLQDDPEFSNSAYSMKHALRKLADEMRRADIRRPEAGMTEPVADHPLEDFQRLQNLSYLLSSTNRLEQILPLFLRNLGAALRASRGLILLRDPRTQTLDLRISRVGCEERPDPGTQEYSEALLERALAEDQVLAWPASSPERAAELEELVRPADRGLAILVVPLTARSTPVGGCYLERPGDLPPFSPKDRLLAEAMGHQAALAVENGRLHEELCTKRVELEKAVRDGEDKNLRLAILNERLDQKVAELSALNAVSRGMNLISTLDDVLRLILEKTMELVGVEKGSIMLVDEDSGYLEVRALLGVPGDEAVDRFARLKIGEGVAGTALRQGSPVIVAEGARDRQFKVLMPSDDAIRNLMCVPLILNGRKLGVINLTNKLDAPGFGESDRVVVSTMASQAAITIENSRLYSMAVFDGLTGLHLPRYFETSLRTELSRARRYGSPLSIVVADLDHFKKVNDIHGHQVGDLVLQHFAQVLKQVKRTIDVAARSGGEEFAVILPETDLEGGRIFAERLRGAAENAPLRVKEHGLVTTVSIGVASHPTSRVRSADQLMALAEKALQRAKEDGRNMVRTTDASEPVPRSRPRRKQGVDRV